jgi:tRNA(adenine34) deaminase
MEEKFMEEALELARQAAADGEVPVGCVIVRGDQIVGRGRNRRECSRNALAHAEVEAIRDACETLGGWRRWDCTMYVTLEPCPMCAGAIINARIPKVVCGAKDAKAGACGSVCDLFNMGFNHHPVITYGTLGEPCADLLTQFFTDLRITLRSRPKWKRPDIE